MPTPDHAVWLEEQIDQWRSYLRRRQAIHSVDVAELEDHLREQVAGLVDAGLKPVDPERRSASRRSLKMARFVARSDTARSAVM